MGEYIKLNRNKLLEFINEYDNNNANAVLTPGQLEYTGFEYLGKKLAETMLSPECLDAYKEGFIYLHDLSQYPYKGLNCITIDPRHVLGKGINCYGDNNIGVVGGPAKHLDTAMHHLGQSMGLSSVYQSGGVALASLNTFIAPYCVDIEDEEIKQVIQSFVYSMNEAFKNRGSQSLFSSVNFDLSMPDFLLETPAVGPGGKYIGTYGDYEDEAIRFVKLWNEVVIKGDHYGKPIFFPNTIYNIDDVDLDNWNDIFEYSAKYSLPYFSSSKNSGVEYASKMGCRTSLPSNWTGDPNQDCMSTGNAVYTTLNLPMIALNSTDINDFYLKLQQYSDIIHDYTIERLEHIKYIWGKGIATFYTQEFEGKPFYNLDNATLVIGFVGLSETCEILTGSSIVNDIETGINILSKLNEIVNKYKEDDNLRWGVFATPAESAAGKLAKSVCNRFGFKMSHAKGTLSDPYYTNSSHVPVGYDIDIIKRIKIESKLQQYTGAGNIMNIYLGEAYSMASGLKSLCKKIHNHGKAFFWAFTGEYSICDACNTTFNGNIEECLLDGEETTVFSRVTGYMTATKTWNKSKQEEFKDRKRY